MDLSPFRGFFNKPLSPAVTGIEGLIELINGPINSFAWGWPTALLITATGILLMARLRFISVWRLGYGFRLLFKPSTAPEGAGAVPPSRR